MNDKLQDLLDGIQRTATQAGDVASDAAYGVGKKASQLLSTAKLNIQICELKADINASFRELGEMLYATHVGNPTDSDDLLHKLEDIDALKARLADLSAQLGRNESRAVVCCPTCGAASRDGDAFCRECGSPLKPQAEETAPAREETAAPDAEPVSPEDFAD